MRPNGKRETRLPTSWPGSLWNPSILWSHRECSSPTICESWIYTPILYNATEVGSLSLKLKWVEQLTDVLCFIHSRNVLHGDISCNNVFLDEQLSVKLGDFAGSAMDDLPRLICYETSHELPEQEDISKRSELFALGSTIYEIMTGSKPHSGLSDEEFRIAFTKGHYPDPESLAAFKDVIIGCWKQSYASADEVLDDVKSEVAKTSNPHVTQVVHSYPFPLVLTALSILPLVLWVKRWKFT